MNVLSPIDHESLNMTLTHFNKAIEHWLKLSLSSTSDNIAVVVIERNLRANISHIMQSVK
jgi:hypothetical protein